MDSPATIIERIARYFANAPTRAGTGDWRDHIDDAATILSLLKDPDPAMEQAGDATAWRRMIDAALVERWALGAALENNAEAQPDGTDEEGETPVAPENVPEGDRAAWVAIGSKARKH
jgi:hypothetical protein